MARLFDIFICDRDGRYLQKTECHHRQRENDRLLDVFNTPGAVAYPLCLDCSQGGEIAVQVDRATRRKKRIRYGMHETAAKPSHPSTLELFNEGEIHD